MKIQNQLNNPLANIILAKKTKSQLSHFQQVTSSNTLPCSQHTVIVNKRKLLFCHLLIFIAKKCSQNDKLT